MRRVRRLEPILQSGALDPNQCPHGIVCWPERKLPGGIGSLGGGLTMLRPQSLVALAAALAIAATGFAQEDQQTLVEEIRAFGGTVERDESSPAKPVVAVTLPEMVAYGRFLNGLS